MPSRRPSICRWKQGSPSADSHMIARRAELPNEVILMSRRRMLKIFVFAAFFGTNVFQVAGQSLQGQRTILFGAAYYDEYAPTDRLDEDVRMMKVTGINVVRIAESTWGTLEPKPGGFDFSHVDRVLDAMAKAGIKVIAG